MAQAQVDALNEQQIADDPYAELLRNANFHTNVYSLHDDVVRDVRPLLVLFQAAVLALLLIGGVNLINLLLIRATGRAKEFAVRQALGAGRVHLAREVLLETFFLAMFGGLLGLGVGAAGVRLLATLGTGQLPLGAETAFDFRLAAISLGGTAFVGVLLAVPIIVFNLRARLAPVLQAETRGGTVSRAAQRVRHGFIIAQVALAFALLTGAGMFGISLKKVLDTPSGFQPAPSTRI
jgi:predicted lysophospholipase L1 biosynthesis ABC-type transport system permease subunit